MSLEAVELTLFGSGIGFVVLEFVARGLPRGCDLDEDVAAVDTPSTWIELAKIVRRGDFFHSAMLHSQLGPLYTAQSRLDKTPPVAPDPHRLRDYLAEMLSTVGLRVLTVPEEPVDLGGNDVVLLWEQNFAFLSLFVAGASETQVRNWTARLRYSVRSRADFVPAATDVAVDETGLQRRSSQSFLYGSLMAAGFIGSDLPTDGYWQHFPSELRHQYQLALLIALQQRHALLTLSSLVSDRWLNSDHNERVTQFNQIQDQLQYLSARLMPVQILARSAQQEFYTTMRKSLEVDSLYQNVRQTISELTESLRLRLSEDQSLQQLRFEGRVSILALVFGVPSLVLAFLAINVDAIETPIPLVLLLIVVPASFTVGLLIALTIRRRGR